ncbi:MULTISPECIES: SRPBCC family protein [unclassified Rhodococcus (in: high G+C Gram-positive bacteria)]|uniref:SRPBCC family protein n=1 Tax=unclassified Rhodococcus (in: high G+C Gram-positive bacteria) TaxID=192944 RepID=UPI001639D6FA|nr:MULTISPECIES: SRPBCC family protein [unclassified Rhodococcus (in: high G+C Gram-positive bacteria)]MBC2641295.1 SRPBCC family protein [Rhodococcus sp. 3A]MBC2893960.1 SRPBCC family protein [Rhodococcus sp. 4CII]
MDRASIVIDVPPAAVWDVVTDVEGMGRFSPENTGARWRSGTPATVGARFVGANRHGPVRWKTHCTVVDVIPEQKFSFEADEPKARWTYHLEPSGTGTRVTETREIYATPVWWVRLVQKSKVLGSNRDQLMQNGMRQTLERMKVALEG